MLHLELTNDHDCRTVSTLYETGGFPVQYYNMIGGGHDDRLPREPSFSDSCYEEAVGMQMENFFVKFRK